MHLNTRRIIIATALGLSLVSSAGAGEPSAKMATVGVLRLGQSSPAVFEAFREGLHALGYIEGETLTFVIREAVGTRGSSAGSWQPSWYSSRLTSFLPGEMRRFVPPNGNHAHDSHRHVSQW
jgi:hypothetical protein